MLTRIFQTKDERNNTLADDLREIASNTWNLIANAYNSGMLVNEETITEMNLLELKLRHPNKVFIKQLSKSKEGKIGADWLWAIVGKSKKVFGMCVQAKRIFPKTNSYESLIEDKLNPTKQIDKLIKNGVNETSFTGKKLFPVYIFYNTWNVNSQTLAQNLFANCCEKDQSYKILGCSYINAYSVRDEIINRNLYLQNYIPISHPWSCLVSCNFSNSTDWAEGLCSRLLMGVSNRETNIGYDSDYLTTIDEAYVVKSVMLNEVNEEILLRLGVKGMVVIEQD